jgi:hypothetical protein
MALQEAPVTGGLRLFDPTAYSGKVKATAPISDPKMEVKVEEKPNAGTLVSVDSSHDDRAVLRGLEPAVYTDLVADAVSTKGPTTAAKPTMDNSGTKRLVSLRVIKKIFNLELNDQRHTFAEVDGWTCKVPFRQYREGELVLYFQVDSFLPGTDGRFGRGFGKPGKYQMLDGKIGQKLKTERFGSGEDKIVAQGMIMPVQTFPEIWKTLEKVRQFISIGQMEKDVELINATLLVMYRDRNWAEVLGVKKWEEKSAQKEGPEHRRLGNYPANVFRRTDMQRLEDCPNLFTKAKYDRLVYQESVKMDGASMVVYFVKKSSGYFNLLNPLPDKVGPNTVLEGAQGARFGVCSNKIDKNELEAGGGSQSSFRFWETALRHDLPTKLSKLNRNIAIQGELCGSPIQGNREGIPDGEQEFFVYAMFDIDKQDFIHPKKVEAMAQELGLKHVPVVGYVKLTEIATSHEDLKKRARQRKGEGLVFKCVDDNRRFKVISNTYLMEHRL